MNEPVPFSQPQPELTFTPAENTAEQSAPGEDAGAVQQPAAERSSDDYTLSVDDIRARLFSIGIEKSKDTIQRYCREGDLECEKFGMLRRYFATPESVDRLLAKLEADAAASIDLQVHEPAHSSVQDDEEQHEPAAKQEDAEVKNLHAPASSNTQPHAGERSEDFDFLKEQIRVKDGQLRVKDELLVTMLERDRETNHLIRDLHKLLTTSLALQAGHDERVRDATDSVVENQREETRPDTV